MNLDIKPNGAIKRVHVSQNDVGRTLTFELFNNSTSYTVPSGATVKIQGTKPSGFGFSETCTVNGNVATIDTTEAMTDESGNIATELSISYNDHKIGTSNFVLAVEKNPHPDTTTDGSMETIIPELTLLVNEVKGYAEEIEGTYHAYGSPWVASTVAEMTDTDKIYVYTGSETGYTNGNWYYYNGSAWTSGGVYNAVAVNTDTTLTQSGVPADAKAVGDIKANLADLEEISENKTNLYNVSNVQIGKNWVGGDATNRAIIYIPVNPSTVYFVEIPVNATITKANVIEKPTNSGGTNLHSTVINGGANAVITTTSTTTYFCIQFESSSTISSSDFENYDVYVCEGSKKIYSAVDKEARSGLNVATNNLNSVSKIINLIDFSQLQIGVNWTGATASNRAVVYLPVEPSTGYFVSNKNNPSNFSITIVEKSINNGSGSSLGAFGVNSEADQTFTTGASTRYICVQFNGSSTITESDFENYGIYICKGSGSTLTAIDDVARRSLDNTHKTFRELVESMNTGIQRVGGYEVRPITYPLEVVRHKEDAVDTPYYDVNTISRQYETTNYHRKVDTKNILNALESEEIDFTPSNNGFTRIVVGKNSDDLFFVAYVASNRVGAFGDPKYDALEVTSDFVNFRTILRSGALSSGDGIPLTNMTNIKVDLVKQFASGEYILAIRCHNISDNNDYTHFYRMSADFTQITHCNYTNFSGNSVSMVDEFSSSVYDWSVFVNGNKAIATTYGNRDPSTDYGRVWYTETGGYYWKQVFQTNNHYQDGQAEGVTVTKTHTHGVMLENINDQTTRLFVLAGEDNRNIFWTDDGMNATDDSWNVIDICNQPFYDFQTFAQVVNGYPFKDGLIFGSDNTDVGCVYRINKLDDGTYSRIESVHELLPNKFNSTSYCSAEMYRRDAHTPLLVCFTKENARYTEADNELLNQYHKARVIATYDGFNFTEIWTDDTYGTHDAYINGEIVQRNYSYCTRGMNCYLLKNGDAVIKYAGRDYYYFGGNPLFSVTGLSNGSCKVKWVKNAEQSM